jgi:hypothetical protein
MFRIDTLELWDRDPTDQRLVNDNRMGQVLQHFDLVFRQMSDVSRISSEDVVDIFQLVTGEEMRSQV